VPLSGGFDLPCTPSFFKYPVPLSRGIWPALYALILKVYWTFSRCFIYQQLLYSFICWFDVFLGTRNKRHYSILLISFILHYIFSVHLTAYIYERWTSLSPIVNFPYLCSNSILLRACSFYVSQPIRIVSRRLQTDSSLPRFSSFVRKFWSHYNTK
jgi:hypothetical protein